MTDISPATAPTQPVTPTQASSPTASVSIGAEFDTFLTLLTAQIKNQDPLAPMDSTQFVEQLATFSSLEQQLQTNSTLESIASMMTSLHAAASSDWVGQSVSMPSSVIRYRGETMSFRLPNVPAANGAALVLRNGNGDVLGRQSLDLSKDTHSWDGRVDGVDSPMPQGDYFVEVEFYSDGLVIGARAPDIISEVESVRVNETGVVLVTKDGQVGPETQCARVK